MRVPPRATSTKLTGSPACSTAVLVLLAFAAAESIEPIWSANATLRAMPEMRRPPPNGFAEELAAEHEIFADASSVQRNDADPRWDYP